MSYVLPRTIGDPRLRVGKGFQSSVIHQDSEPQRRPEPVASSAAFPLLQMEGAKNLPVWAIQFSTGGIDTTMLLRRHRHRWH